MATRMLIDATHAEETRVVVVEGNRLTEFDFETSTKKQLKGNIYLAKVTRVEPSLQAAFVDYGGNRDGFLPFNDIHPDYYQIPIADREALLARQAAEDEAASRLDDEAAAAGVETETVEAGDDDAGDLVESDDEAGDAVDNTVEDVGGDELEEVSRAPTPTTRPYKIQEVIKRRQILLVQVVKEERGNKGAALTTYLSLAGRYCVLMPNTARGGGISRKIVSLADRKRLREIADTLDVSDGMAVIVRTAGMNRTKPEIKRDFEYLLRLWDDIREITLKSTAPSLVYEEANLIKRSIRDLYNADIEEILVEGDDSYRAAKSFMRMLVPSRAKVVQPYRERVPLFNRFKVEEQFDALHGPEVHLKSGGYIVINPTEALVSIDVNSGRATKERNIEQTALRTNLEAADELARQIRLRDLSGLIVIDFIDMEVSKNKRAVERRLKERLKSDRARIQVGRISPFGLLEMSRQRLRPSLVEASSQICGHCAGTGVVRSTESSALHVLRAVEQEGLRKQGGEISVHVATPVALYLLNFKRAAMATMQERYDLSVYVLGDDALVPPEIRIERDKAGDGTARRRRTGAAAKPAGARQQPSGPEGEDEAAAEESGGKRRRKPRRRKRAPEEAEKPVGEVVESESGAEAAEQAADEELVSEGPGDEAGEQEQAEEAPRKRRRGKRGGRRRSRAAREKEAAAAPEAPDEAVPAGDLPETKPEAMPETQPADAEPEPTAEAEAPRREKPRRPRRKPRARAAPKTAEVPAPEDREVVEPPDEVVAEDGPAPAPEPGKAKPAPQPVAAELGAPPPPRPAGQGEDDAAPGAPREAPEPLAGPLPLAASADEAEKSAALAEGGEEEKAPKQPTRRGWWRRPSI